MAHWGLDRIRCRGRQAVSCYWRAASAALAEAGKVIARRGPVRPITPRSRSYVLPRRRTEPRRAGRACHPTGAEHRHGLGTRGWEAPSQCGTLQERAALIRVERRDPEYHEIRGDAVITLAADA